jgi:hypothetical protein
LIVVSGGSKEAAAAELAAERSNPTRLKSDKVYVADEERVRGASNRGEKKRIWAVS